MNQLSGKIFGIGLPRTGTTSLHLALQQLGVDSVHFPFALWEHRDYPMLDRYDAFCDGPIYSMYPELNRLCPNSSFILTTRPLEGWLDSMEWLLKNGKDIWGWSPAFDRFHAEFFGSARFNRKLYAAAYKRHHDEVYRWCDRHKCSLLVLDAAKGYGYPDLCGFLDLAIPESPYPKSNPARLPSWPMKWAVRAGVRHHWIGRIVAALFRRISK